MRSGIREKTLLQLQPLPLGSPLKGLSLISMPLGLGGLLLPNKQCQDLLPRLPRSPVPLSPVSCLSTTPLGASDGSLFFMCLHHYSWDAFMFTLATIEKTFFSTATGEQGFSDCENADVLVSCVPSPNFFAQGKFLRRNDICQRCSCCSFSLSCSSNSDLQHPQTGAGQVVVRFQ